MQPRVAPDRARVTPRALFLFAQACIFFKQHARALQALEALLREAPDHARAWSIAGFLYAEKSRHGDAIAAFERALSLAPDDPATRFNLGFVLQKAGRHEEALGHLAHAVELNPALDRAWYGLGLSLIHCGRFREAMTKIGLETPKSSLAGPPFQNIPGS